MTRVFVMGNGPSLKDAPFNLLENEACLAMNRINFMWNEVIPGLKWRPTHYLKIDHNFYTHTTWKDEVMEVVSTGIPCYMWDGFKDGLPEKHPNHDTLPDGIGDHPNITWLPRCEHHYYMAPNPMGSQGWHEPVCTGYGGMSTMLQIAARMFDEIYLLGCDLNYGSDYKKNHFTDKYCDDMRDRSEMDNLNMMKLHEMAKECSPVPIYNATPGGSLEVYPRVNIMDVLNE